MADKTKIDWCDASWNPVTGCLHGCEYCYARNIANRFGGSIRNTAYDLREKYGGENKPELLELEHPYKEDGRVIPYPCKFTPTFHRYRLDIPARWTRPRTIFVCSMADLFGDWVPDEWITEILDACRKAPQHRYLFLTKNPRRYEALVDAGIIADRDKNFWLGSTAAIFTQDLLYYNCALHTFVSCEPMLAPWPPAGKPNQTHLENGDMPEWVIFGAETGNRKGKVIPEKAWVNNAVQMCRNIGAKVFMKESLRGIMGADFVQEYPWEADT